MLLEAKRYSHIEQVTVTNLCMTLLLAAHSIPYRSFSSRLCLLHFCHLTFSGHFSCCSSCFSLSPSVRTLRYSITVSVLASSSSNSMPSVEIHLGIHLSIPASSHSNEIAPPTHSAIILGSIIALRNTSLIRP